MKKSRKLMSILLIVAMLFTLAAPAMAGMEGELTGGSITIKDAVSGQTYNAYQILYLESYDADSNAYAYKANSQWKNWLETQTQYVEFDDQGYVTWKDGADVVGFAKLAQAKAATLTADATQTVTEANPATSDNVVTFTGLKLGYYLVDTTLGALCALDTTNPNVEMEEKNEAPTVTKKVEEDSTGDWGATNDADINQVVNYKATITVQKGAENYVLHDKMSEGLTYNDVTGVKIGDKNVPADKYTVKTTEMCKDCTFEVAFDNEYIATLEAGTQIEVYYSATLNENAVVGLEGNPNEVKLQYGDINHPTYTPKQETITYTWDMKVVKYTVKAVVNDEGEEETEEIKLAGAKFELSTDAAGSNVIKFHALGNNKYEVCAAADCKDSRGHETEITTDSTGTFHIEGLDSGKYYLTETEAPAGYNKLQQAVEVEITGATSEGETLTYSTVEAKVENKTGTELPETGGMGTTIFYVVGGALVLGAAVLLVTRRRMAE